MGEGKSRRRLAVLAIFCGVLLVSLALIIVPYTKPISLYGAVIREDTDPKRQSPITDVEITASDESTLAAARSDFSGYFKLTLPRGVLPGHAVVFHFRHPDYRPLDLKETIGDKLYLVRLTPLQPEDAAPSPQITVSNVFVRYAIETTTALNIGTGIKTFQVENTANVRCDHHPPCSPDGKWKAAIASASLDAGNGNEYQDARISCIAGACPFTKIVSDQFSHGGRTIAVSVLGWSDTTTFLLQAEVFRNEVGDIVRESYPVIFGDSLNFTLPAAAEGPSLEAEINGAHIVFPLGPGLELSWADCNARIGKNQSKLYRCELKHGYHFR